MAQTTGIVETFTSCFNWHIENAIEWKEAAKSAEFRLRTERIKIENFPMKWRIEVFSDGRSETGLKFKIRLVQNKGTVPEAIENSHYQLKVFIIRGSDRVNWLYYDSGRSLLKLLADNTFEQYIGKLFNLKSFLNGLKDFDIQVNVKIFQDVLEEKYIERVDGMFYKLDALNYFKGLLEDKGSSNATLIFGGNSYNVHKALLSARSNVFAELFEKSPDVKEYNIYGEVNKESVDAFIKFIYTGDCEIQSFENAKTLMKLANDYKIDDLKEIYENMVMTHVNTLNSMEMLQFAVKHGSAYGLKEAAFNAFKKKYLSIDIDVPDELINTPNDLMNFAADAMIEMVSKMKS